MLTLTCKTHLSDNLWAFEFAPSQPLSWVAGQFIRVELPHPHPDVAGSIRRFTIAAAPHEGLVRITTRLGPSSFKQALEALPMGGQLQLLDLPAGDFVWGSGDAPHLLVAAGVGITPFYAMLADRVHHGLPLPAHLLYFHRQTPLPFGEELAGWAAARPEFQVTTHTHPFSLHDLKPYQAELTGATIYMSGPTATSGLMLPPFNLSARRIKQDTFTGYRAEDY